MANPQKENGHVEIANEILEALCHTEIPGRQHRVFDVIMRKTWGWNKKSDRIPLLQISELTGIEKSDVCRVLNWLKDANMIRRDSQGMTSIQKDYEKWAVPSKPVARKPVARKPVARKPGTSGAEANQPVAPAPHSKDNLSKDTIQKTIRSRSGPDENFEKFWAAYPRKVAKAKAVQSWARIKPDPPTMDKIMDSLEAHKASSQWNRDGGEYIPHPTTWLNQRRWEDELRAPAPLVEDLGALPE